MKIMSVETYTCFAYRCNWLFIKITTDEDIVGWGEGTLEGRERTVEAAVAELARYLVGQDPRKIELHRYIAYRNSFWRTGPVLNTALSAVECALWDIKGKWLGVPIYELLGGCFRDKVKAYANGWFHGAKSPKEFGQRARQVVALGFRALKWDPFGKTSLIISSEELREAMERVAAVRDAVGWEVDLLIEGHGRFNTDSALRIARELEPFKPLWFEEPLPPEDIRTLAYVRSHSRIPIATGERFYGRWEFRTLLEERGADVIQPDLTHVGGLLEGKEIAAMADAYFVPVAPHNPTGPVANAVTLQFAACTPNFYMLEIMSDDVPWRKEIVRESLQFENGFLRVPSGPGLGVEVIEEASSRYPYQPKDMDHHYSGELTDIRPESATTYFKEA